MAMAALLLLLLLSSAAQSITQQAKPDEDLSRASFQEQSAPCGSDNQRACPADPPDKPYPYCTEPDTYALYPGGYSGTITDDFLQSLEGWCWRIDPECGTAPGKPCCPNGYRQGSNPDLPNTSCNDNSTLHHDVGEDPQSLMYCQVDATHPATKMYDSGNSSVSYRAGTCVRNAPDCGQAGKSCCYWESGCCASPICTDATARCEVAGGVPPGVCVLQSESAGTDSSSSSSSSRPSADPSG